RLSGIKCSLLTDGRSDAGHVLPAMAGTPIRETSGPKSPCRNFPTDVPDIGRSPRRTGRGISDVFIQRHFERLFRVLAESLLKPAGKSMFFGSEFRSADRAKVGMNGLCQRSIRDHF